MEKEDKSKIEQALAVLNQVDVRGLENCKRITFVAQVLMDLAKKGEG